MLFRSADIIPFAFIHFQIWTQKKFAFTNTQKKNASIVTVKYILYFWFLDCLYMTIFNQWEVWIYVLGIITLVKIFYSLAIAFLGKKQKNIVLDISLVFDFLLGIGLTVYLIYLIPESSRNLQTIVTTIVAAVYGGLLTLVGVAWTIRKGDKDRKEDLERRDKEKAEEERKRLVPYIRITRGEVPLCAVNASAYNCVKLHDLGKQHFFSYIIKDFNIKNISESNIFLKGIYIDDKYFSFSYDNVIEKNTVCQIQTTRNSEYQSAESLKKLSLIVADTVGNEYEVSCTLHNKPGGYIEEYTDQDEKFTGFRSTYTIENLSLPKLIPKEN